MSKTDQLRARRLGRKAKDHGMKLERDNDTGLYFLIDREFDNVSYPADSLPVDLDEIETHLASLAEDV